MSIFSKVLKRKTSIQTETTVGFEIEDKPTPLAGKILLIIMAVLLLFLGWRALSDIYDLVRKPEKLSTCINPYVTKKDSFSQIPLYEYNQKYTTPDYSSKKEISCRYSKIEEKYQIPQIYQEFTSAKIKYDQLQNQISTAKSDLNRTSLTLKEKQQQYNLSLQEQIADKQGIVYDPDKLKNEVEALERQKLSLNQHILDLENQAFREKSLFKPQESKLIQAAKTLSKDYNRLWAIYRLKVFLLQLLFTLPAFILAFKYYLKLKAKDSPYTLILTTILGVSAVLLTRIAISYLWTLFLADLVSYILDLVKYLVFLRTIFYYLGMIFVIIIFGGAVYYLQKKVFDPRRVKIRKLRKSVCPYCEFPLRFTKKYCSGCGKQVMKKCPHCGKEKYEFMQYCQNCGKEC